MKMSSLVSKVSGFSGFAVGLVMVSNLAMASVPQPYGAIAYSPSDAKIGIATEKVNQEAAEQHAMGQCAVMAGGKDCRVVVWFYNACAAVSRASNGAWGADIASTTRGELMRGINAAHTKARAHCQHYGGTDCQLLQATCSFDPQ